MKKLFSVAAVAALALSFALISPGQASHNAEGTITVGGVELCSSESGSTVKDGKCTWVATDANGWAGTGPFKITWTKDGITKTFTCFVGNACTSPSPDPIPAGATVTSDGSGGGSFAAGDADGHGG